MAKKFKEPNSRATAANEKKAQAKAKKDQQKARQEEAQLTKEWSKGAKDTTRQQEQEQKRLEKEERRREAQRQLEEENKQLPTARGAQKKALQKTDAASHQPVEEYAARTIDDALDLFDNLEESTGDPASSNKAAAALVDRHPERRAKAAYRQFEDREMARLKQENPGLRMSQLKERLKKLWQKSPENPLNQSQVAHNAKQEDIESVAERQRQETIDRLRV